MELQFLTTLALCVGLAAAIPQYARAMITVAPRQELPPRANLIKRWEFSSTCSADYLSQMVSAFRNPPSTFDTARNTSVAFDMSSWCNTFFQESYYSTTSTTYRAPTTTTIITSTKTTTTRSQTNTVLCPAPSASAICNTTGTLKESFISSNFLSTEVTASGETCKTACLKEKSCSSFVLTEDKEKKVFDRNYCTLYKASLNGAFEGKGTPFDETYYRFWDRSCAIYAAPGCSLVGSAGTVSTASAPTPTHPPTIAKRDWSVPIPQWVYDMNLNWYYMEYGCSCVVTSSPVPILVGTQTRSIPQYDLRTITTTRTAVSVSVSVPVTSTYTYVALR